MIKYRSKESRQKQENLEKCDLFVHGLISENILRTLKFHHNTIINGEKYDKVVNDICVRTCKSIDEVKKALADEISDLCGFRVRLRESLTDDVDLCNHIVSKSKCVIVEDIERFKQSQK